MQKKMKSNITKRSFLDREQQKNCAGNPTSITEHALHPQSPIFSFSLLQKKRERRDSVKEKGEPSIQPSLVEPSPNKRERGEKKGRGFHIKMELHYINPKISYSESQFN